MRPFPQDPNPENLEVVETEVLMLIGVLYEEYGGAEFFDALPQDIQDEWYWVEQEAKCGADRNAAKSKLESLIEKLKAEKDKL